MSRILTILLLLRAGYSYVPYNSLESVIEQSREAYYLALRQTQVTVRTDVPNWLPWVVFFLRALQQQMTRLAMKIEREKIVLATLPQLSVRIIEHAREPTRGLPLIPRQSRKRPRIGLGKRVMPVCHWSEG